MKFSNNSFIYLRIYFDQVTIHMYVRETNKTVVKNIVWIYNSSFIQGFLSLEFIILLIYISNKNHSIMIVIYHKKNLQVGIDS